MHLTERLARYDRWLDLAEERIAEWLGRADDPDPNKKDDIRATGAAVNTLRVIIDVRRKLEAWKIDEETDPEESDPGESRVAADPRILALIKRHELEDEESTTEEEMPP